MKSINQHFLAVFLLLSQIFGQFKKDIATNSLPSNLNGELNNIHHSSLFNPARFDIQHGFSMSMSSLGGNPISMAAYTSDISYWASDKLLFNAKIMLYNTSSKFTGSNIGSIQNLQLAYDARMTIRPTKNSILSFELRSPINPSYRYNNYYLNQYQRSFRKSLAKNKAQE